MQKILIWTVLLILASALFFSFVEAANAKEQCSTLDQQISGIEKSKPKGVYTTKILSEKNVPKAFYFLGYYRSNFYASMAVFDTSGCMAANTPIPNPMAVFELLTSEEKAALFIKTSSH